MKNSGWTIIVLCALILAGCKSKEERISELLSKKFAEKFYFYKTYVPIETVYAEEYKKPCNSPEIIKLGAKIQKYQENMREIARTQLQLSNPHLDKREIIPDYNENIDYFGFLSVISDSYKDSIQDVKNNIIRLLPKEKQKIGYGVLHKFRYKDKNNEPHVGQAYCVVDNELNKIIFMQEWEDKEYQNSLLDIWMDLKIFKEAEEVYPSVRY